MKENGDEVCIERAPPSGQISAWREDIYLPDYHSQIFSASDSYLSGVTKWHSVLQAILLVKALPNANTLGRSKLQCKIIHPSGKSKSRTL